MTEKLFEMSKASEKTIKRIIADENVHINQMILRKGDSLPQHYSNSTVYMTVLRGTVALRLNDQETHDYGAGSILKIPFNTLMNAENRNDELLELLVIKAPAPKI